MCNKLIKISKGPFGECNSAENTNKSINFCQVCTTSRNRHAGNKPRGIHKGGGSHEQWTHHLSSLRQDIRKTNSSKPHLPIASNSLFLWNLKSYSLVQQVRAVNHNRGPGWEGRHFFQSKCMCVGGKGQQLLNDFLWHYPRAVLKAGKVGGRSRFLRAGFQEKRTR